jgi:hypothetical protein
LVFLGWSTALPREWTTWRGPAVSLVGIIGAAILGGLVDRSEQEGVVNLV